MSAGAGVVLALVGRWEGTKSAQMAVGMEGFAATGENLVPGSLMPHVPDDTVVGGVEDVVQGYSQLHNAQPAGKMSWIVGHLLYDFLAEFAAYLRQSFEG